MTTRIIVISDLHLGGVDGFQICSREGRKRLAHFVDWAGGQMSEVDNLRLVLNGDVIDFLAERDDAGGFSAFCADEAEALRKFRRIADSCEDVFSALKRYVSTGSGLTILLGNHDIELSLPAVRSEFLSRIGGGLVDFRYDNEAYTIGPVLIEHGNRYDTWNMVNHNQLREIRSHLSRREMAANFAAQPGSELVASVMNPIKREYAFVDLLKPETGAVVPILAVLNPTLWRRAAPVLQQRIAAWYRGQFSLEGIPERSDYVAATPAPVNNDRESDVPESLIEPFSVANKLVSRLSEGDDRIASIEELSIVALLKAFRGWRTDADLSFGVGHEDFVYLAPAKALAKRGFKVVVFGHTHLAKHISLENGAVYLNTGTWADLMRLPANVYAGSESEGAQALKRFLDRVKNNDIVGFRRQVATFACINLDSRGDVEKAGTYFFDDDSQVSPISTSGLQERLT
jgi:UDP-2,3-diacylglucosamine pyrophosphatase LpxH